MKKYLAAPLILCSIALASGSVFADGANNPPQSVSSDSSSLITPMASEGIPAKSLSGTEMSYKFDVTKKMPYWRVWIQNTSSYDYKVTVTKGSSTGKVVYEETIKAGVTRNIWSDGAYAAGKIYVNFTSGKGNMSGTVSARIASSQSEVKP